MNDNLCCNTFNFLVLNRLYETGFSDGQILCLGVSGGADSICLLTAIANALDEKKVKQPIYVFTVDHKIRSKEESGGDCDFVKNYCDSLNQKLHYVKIICEVCELKKGQVLHEAEIRNRGIEEAARYLRYKVFENKILLLLNSSENKKAFIALAHNENDQVETLIMRFLSGSDSGARGGIQVKRTVLLENDKEINYVRPLLKVSRKEIEEYLTQQNILWRTDATNSNNDYLRNKIRNSIIPVLDKNVPGWKTGVLSGSEKANFENSFLEKSIEGIEWQTENGCLFMNQKDFECLDFVQKERLVYRAINQVCDVNRMPFSFVKAVCNGEYNICKNGVEITAEQGLLKVKKSKKKATIYGFFDIIEEDGLYDFDFGSLIVKSCKSGLAELEFVTKGGQNYYLNKVPVPFSFRSRQLSDWVYTKSKSKKSVSDVLSDFKIDADHKNLIPVIEDLSENGKKNIIAVWGNIFGYKNWIV